MERMKADQKSGHLAMSCSGILVNLWLHSPAKEFYKKYSFRFFDGLDEIRREFEAPNSDSIIKVSVFSPKDGWKNDCSRIEHLSIHLGLAADRLIRKIRLWSFNEKK